jgi:hypothetical protein
MGPGIWHEVGSQQDTENGTQMEILFDGNIIRPSETLESLGILFSKECIPYAQIERVRSSVRTMRTLIRKNYRIRTPEIMLRLYKTYILPKISYCSQQWHTGLEKHVSSIERELASFWRLCDMKVAPGGFLGLREQLILNDLILMHRIWKGVSTISFDEFFTICDHQKNTEAKNRSERVQKGVCKEHLCAPNVQVLEQLSTRDTKPPSGNL